MAGNDLRYSKSYVARPLVKPHRQLLDPPSSPPKVERHRKRKRKDKGESALELEEVQNAVDTKLHEVKDKKKSKPKKSVSLGEAEVSSTKKSEVKEVIHDDHPSGIAGLSTSEELEQSVVEEEKRKKRKREDSQNTDPSSEEKPTKTKKSKKNEPLLDTVPLDEPTESTTKKKKNSTGFSDPRKDTELSDQSQKALTYAFTQFYKPKKWKFNKARQNWLLRNMWSSKEIPETYFTLVVAYLAKVQGGTREHLLKSCKQATEVPTEPPAPNPTPIFAGAVAPQDTAAEANQTKATRAKAILEVLERSQAS